MLDQCGDLSSRDEKQCDLPQTRNHARQKVGWRAVRVDCVCLGGLSGERALGASVIVIFINATKRTLIAHAAQRKTFSFSAEGYNSSLAILAPFAEDKLHINCSDIIPFFTNNM